MVASVTIVLTLALAVGAWFTRGLPRWARWLAVGDLRRARPRRRRSGRSPSTRTCTRRSSSRTCCSRSRCSARRSSWGSRRSRSAAATRTPLDREPRLAGLGDRRRLLRCCSSSGTLATAAGPHSGGENVYRLWRLHPALLLHGTAVAVLGCSLMFLIGYLLARRAAIGRALRRGRRRAGGARARADGARRHPVPDASPVGARARPRRDRGDGLGGDGRASSRSCGARLRSRRA